MYSRAEVHIEEAVAELEVRRSREERRWGGRPGLEADLCVVFYLNLEKQEKLATGSLSSNAGY